jgi:DNA-binding NtrC family response regulator
MAATKILVIDDENANAEIIQDSLEDVGYEILTASSVAIAKKTLKDQKFSLIILDIWMPEVDGISFLRELKQTGDKTPVIMISGHAEHNDVVEAMRLGAIDFIKKPISDISSIVRNALNEKTKNDNAINFNQPLKQARLDFEKAYLAYHLQQNDNNITKVAQISHIERTTLYRKIKDLKLK